MEQNPRESSPDSSPDSSIDYIEFGATDIERTKAFYNAVFGWRFTDYGPDYTSFEDGSISGGFTTEGAVGGSPLVVLYCRDLEQARERVIGCGGFISREIFSFPGGRRFHFKDPNGNELAAWCEPKGCAASADEDNDFVTK